MKFTFIGHAGFIIKAGKTIVIDPFINGNPVATIKTSDIKADYVLVSHGHVDHLGDAIEITKQSGATLISVFELATYATRHGVNAHPMHIGGSHQFDGMKLKLTQAWHGSGLTSEDGPAEYLGNPCGFIIELDGKTIYHSGDTGLFGDMEIIGRRNDIDMALLPIGDNFTMGPEDALEAIKLLKPATVIPMHYNTWPLIEQNPISFKNDVEKETPAKVILLKPGESYNL